MAFRFVLPAFAHMPIERGVWYLGAFWPGVLINVVTTKIPIDRLLPSDIDGDKGAIIAITLIAIALFAVAINQARVMRKTGWLFHYAFWYGTGGLSRIGPFAAAWTRITRTPLHPSHDDSSMYRLSDEAVCDLPRIFPRNVPQCVAAFDFDSILQTAAEVSLIVRPLNALTHCIAATTRCARRNSFTHILDQLEHMECIDSIYQPVHLLERHSSCGQ